MKEKQPKNQSTNKKTRNKPKQKNKKQTKEKKQPTDPKNNQLMKKKNRTTKLSVNSLEIVLARTLLPPSS